MPTYTHPDWIQSKEPLDLGHAAWASQVFGSRSFACPALLCGWAPGSFPMLGPNGNWEKQQCRGPSTSLPWSQAGPFQPVAGKAFPSRASKSRPGFEEILQAILGSTSSISHLGVKREPQALSVPSSLTEKCHLYAAQACLFSTARDVTKTSINPQLPTEVYLNRAEKSSAQTLALLWLWIV